MNANQRILTSWDEFKDLPNNEVRTDHSQAIYDFHGRWMFTASFNGVIAAGYKDATIPEVYHAFLKVLLACSAREQLRKVLGLPKNCPHDLPACDEALASRVRSEFQAENQAKLKKSLLKSGNGVKEPLEEFFDCKSADLAPIAFAIRHGVAHGSITPTGAGIRKSNTVNIVLAIATSILSDSDRRFTEWVLTQKNADATSAQG